MRVTEVDRRYGKTANKWVWVAGPMYLFEADGKPRSDLVPVDEVTPEHYEDDNGWWTCHPDTRTGDLAVIYRSGARNDPGRMPTTGPKDLCQAVLVTSDAFPLAKDPLAGEFSEKHGCLFAVVAQFNPTVAIQTLRADPVISTWSALRAGFVQGASRLPEDVWRRLVELDNGATARTPPPRRPSAAERRAIERRLEEWLSEHLDELEPLAGCALELVGTQWPCGKEHGGVIDMLLRRPDRRGQLVVVELKADFVMRDAIAQALGYVGWLRHQHGIEQVSALVIGLGVQSQVPWVLSMLAGEVTVHHWDALALPVELREMLDG